VTDHPLRPVTDRRLGRPLPYQLANPTSAHPPAPGLTVPSFDLSISCGISSSFPELSPTKGQIPMYSSPVRRSPPDCSALPLDLHVLGMPPAFNLSQDQTLQFILACKAAGFNSQLSTKIFQHNFQFNTNLHQTQTYFINLSFNSSTLHFYLIFHLLGRFLANQVRQAPTQNTSQYC
jgi:hypothetical protein